VKRFAALLAAVGMIAVAVLIRSAVDDDRDSAGSPRPGSNTSAVVLVCVTELARACEILAEGNPSIEIRTEEVATTLATLTDAGLDSRADAIDGWLTFAPFPQMADEDRARAGLQPALGEVGPTLGRSPLVIAIWDDRRQALATACAPSEITWSCIGESSGRPWPDVGGQAAWGAMKPGHPLPDRTAVGLLTVAQASASKLGRTDYASNDFADPAFRAWFENLERGVPYFTNPPRTPLDEMLSKGPAAFDLTGSTEAAAGPAIARSRDRDRLSIIYPSPLATADVVLAVPIGSDGEDRLRDLLESDEGASALAGAGWRVEGLPTLDGVPTEPDLPPDNGLPRPGVLQALRSLWIEVVR
jgi:hypothetical protein